MWGCVKGSRRTLCLSLTQNVTKFHHGFPIMRQGTSQEELVIFLQANPIVCGIRHGEIVWYVLVDLSLSVKRFLDHKFLTTKSPNMHMFICLSIFSVSDLVRTMVRKTDDIKSVLFFLAATRITFFFIIFHEIVNDICLDPRDCSNG